jgi:hypothetical protein
MLGEVKAPRDPRQLKFLYVSKRILSGNHFTSDDQSAKKYRYIQAMLGKKVDTSQYVILQWGIRTFSQI